MTRFTVTIAAIATITIGLFNMSAYAAGEDSLSQGLSESQIGQKAGTWEVQSLKSRYGLKDGFTEADLRDGASVRGVRDLMIAYRLSPDFTAEDFRRAAGANAVVQLFKEFPNLSPLFTVQQLAAQMALEHLGHLDAHLKAPFSYADYVQAKGLSLAQDLLKYSGLPTTFVYADLIQTIGPQDAAVIRRTYGFAKDASHDEIVHSMGVFAAAAFDKELVLKEGFTAQDLLDSLTQAALATIKTQYGLDATATCVQYAAAAGDKALSNLLNTVNGGRKLISSTFTEADYGAAVGEDAVDYERDRYDLDPGFTESDVFKAAAASAQADERVLFHLPRGFTAKDDAAAKKG